jgi:hypothetical protein
MSEVEEKAALVTMVCGGNVIAAIEAMDREIEELDRRLNLAIGARTLLIEASIWM